MFWLYLYCYGFDKNANSSNVGMCVCTHFTFVSLATIGVCVFCAVASVAAFLFLGGNKMQCEDSVSDFIKRTSENYEFYIKNRSVTNLLNCSAELFVLPEEMLLDSIANSWVTQKLLDKLKNNTISNFDELINLKNICIHIKKGIKCFYFKTLTDSCQKITALIIEDKEYVNRKNCGFKITFSIELLEKFFLEFSKSIINQLNIENT